MNRFVLPLIAVVALSWGALSASAQTTRPAAPIHLALATVVQDGQKLIQITATRAGKPVSGLTVTLSVQRLFGRMKLGHDQTYDDGTAYVPFPTDLPGGPKGQLKLYAQVTAPAADAAVTAQATVGGAVVVPAVAKPFPRALWSPRPPLLLAIVIVGLMLGVWLTYAYVVLQMVLIRKGALT